MAAETPKNQSSSATIAHLRGAKNLIADGVEHGSRSIERSQHALSRNIMAILARATGKPARLEPLQKAIWLAIAAGHGNVRLVSRVTSAVLDAVAQVSTSSPSTQTAPVPLRSDIVGSQPWLWDTFLAVINGVVGDHLAATSNPLAMAMTLRYDDAYLDAVSLARRLQAITAALPDQTAPANRALRVAVFVHGLTATEWSWSIDAEQQHGAADMNYGTLLRDELGIEPIFVRYNSGLHISDNGKALCAQLDALVATLAEETPDTTVELIFIGHSMGGLVVQSALQYALHRARHHARHHALNPAAADRTAAHSWLTNVRHVVSLGTPHAGAPLEKFGQLVTTVLAAIATPGTQVTADVLGARSAGIKDLRHGTIVEADWRDAEAGVTRPRTPPIYLKHVRNHRVVATITADPAHPIGRMVGDAMVRPESASGRDLQPSQSATDDEVAMLGAVSHMALSNHAQVVPLLRAWLRVDAAAVT